MNKVQEIYHNLRKAIKKGNKKAQRYWMAKRDALFKKCTGYDLPKERI